MKLEITAPGARSAACVAVGARLFIGLTLEKPAIHNGAWICALLGGAIALPWALALGWLQSAKEKRSARAMLPLSFALLICLVTDASLLFSAATRSAGYLTLDRRDPAALLIPAALALLWCVLRGGDAVGYGAMIWMRLFPALMLVVVLLQFRHYRPQWLAPVLGTGWTSILLAGARSAGRVMLASGVLLVADREEGRGDRLRAILRAHLLGILAAAGLIVLRLMMTPTSLSDPSWMNRLDSLLVNGRAPLYLQLPMITLWYAGMMHLLACECFTAAVLTQRLLPGVPGRLCAVLAPLTAALLSCSNVALRLSELSAPWFGTALALCAALACLQYRGREGGAAPCAQ